MQWNICLAPALLGDAALENYDRIFGALHWLERCCKLCSVTSDLIS